MAARKKTVRKASAKAILPLVPAASARRLLFAGQGMLEDPARRATPAAVYRQIERMAFVQMDTINVVERAHDHILHTRFDGYEPRMLRKLVEKDRKLFEHWTHDLSAIPTRWFAHWRLRFRGHERRMARYGWHKRMGKDPDGLLDEVRERLREEGPLLSRDFEHEGDGQKHHWWSGKPQKMALEYLWRVGEIGVSRRVEFQKAFDLIDRIIPDLHAHEEPTPEEHLDWACSEALDRLSIASGGELASFFDGIPARGADAWAKAQVAKGAAVEVRVESVDGKAPRKAYAVPDWERRARRAGDPPDRTRLLSPFDPVIRDRARLQRLFGFDYRVEIFVPPKQRQYGYYVLPILEGETLVGRLDPKIDRDSDTLVVNGVWWETGVKPTRARKGALEEALERLTRQIGASQYTLPARKRRG